MLSPSCPCTGSAAWPESRGTLLTSVSLNPFPTQKLFISIPTCSSMLRHKVEIISGGAHFLFPTPQSRCFALLLLEHREMLACRIPTSPSTFISKLSQSFQSSSSIQFWSHLQPALSLNPLSWSTPMSYLDTVSATGWHVSLLAGNGFYTWLRVRKVLICTLQRASSHLTTWCLPWMIWKSYCPQF